MNNITYIPGTTTSINDNPLQRPNTLVNHQYVNQKYKFIIERASTKGIDGFKVEVNSDDIEALEKDILILYNKAKAITGGLYA